MMKRVLLFLFLFAAQASAAVPPRFSIMISNTASRGPVTGRLLVIVSKREQPEPRLSVSPQGPALFAIDIEAVQPGQTVTVDERALGYPVRLAELPKGEYFVQAVVNVYEQVRRADGHTIWVKMNDGQQETFGIAAGNLYSPVQRVRLEENAHVRLEINNMIPPASAQPADTEWVKRVRIQSDKLTKFWGRPVYIHATVLLPRGYATQTSERYPTVYTLGHNVPFSFTTDSHARATSARSTR